MTTNTITENKTFEKMVLLIW